MTPALPFVLALLQAVPVPADSGEGHLMNIRQLTFGGQNAEAYFSASGKKLIFQREDSVPGGICDQEHVMNVDGTGVTRVSTGTGRTTCGWFFAHDARIFYASTDRASRLCPPRPDYSHGYVWALYDYDIFAADSDGSHRVRLTHNRGYDAEGTLSPDGATIVFTSQRHGDLDIYTMKTNGSRLRRLTHTLGYDGGPIYSPDGRLIAYRAFHPATAADSAEYRTLLAQGVVRPTRMDLWIMNADGTNQHQITHLAGASFAPAFTPDGRRLIFATNFPQPTTENFDLYLVNLDGSGLERVTTSPVFDAFPMFSPDGKTLVWESNRHATVAHETNIFIADWVERP
jgi:TolB protein